MDIKENLNNFEDLCRICLQSEQVKGSEFTAIFSTSINALNINLSELFTLFTRIQIDEQQVGFPTLICTNCHDTLIAAYEFQLKCIKANHEIRTALGPPPQKSEEDSIEPVCIIANRSGISDENSIDNLSANHNMGSDDTKKKRVNTCLVCDMFFDHPSHLLRHTKIHNTEGKPYECVVCKRRFTLEKLMIVHQRKHYLQIEMNPSHSLDDNNSHVKNKKTYTCEICDKSFDKYCNLIRHSNVHNSDGKPVACQICKKRFTVQATLVRHEFIHSIDLKVKSQSFPTPLKQTNKNALNKISNKEYCCVFCKQNFGKFGDLTRHVKEKHTTGTNRPSCLCAECGKEFSNTSTLNQHMKYHSDIRPFQCSECPSKFHTGGILKSHMLSHTGFKPHACEICGATFTKNYSLKKHMLIHTGERPHPCNMCEKKFNSASHLTRHMRIHTGEKPYKCEYCNRAFSQTTELNNHSRLHIGENTYRCKECPAAFRLQRELKKHNQEHYQQKQNKNI